MGQTVELMDRITVNADQCVGHPCVRGMRIRVSDVLDLQKHEADGILSEWEELTAVWKGGIYAEPITLGLQLAATAT